MDELIKWVGNNKEWLFSGVGVVVVAWIVRIVYRKKQISSYQNIRSGRNSTNIQAGRDVKINSKSKLNDVEEER